MKKILFVLLHSFFSLITFGQAVSSLSENFNTACTGTTAVPAGWLLYTPTAPAPEQYDEGPATWQCNATEGRDGTGCMVCTGYYSSTAHLDTSFLITPMLDVSTYSDSAYLRFDTKTTFVSGSEFSVLASTDSMFDSASTIRLSLNPIIGPGDTTGWVTHEVNVTYYKHFPFYVGFRYTSPTTYGTIWYIDNINTATISLSTPQVANQKIPLTIIGSPSASAIKFSYTVNTSGPYTLDIYDALGREVYNKQLNAMAGTTTYSIDDLNLRPGILLLKVSNGTSYGITRTMVQ
jgi:hypothetical protein